MILGIAMNALFPESASELIQARSSRIQGRNDVSLSQFLHSLECSKACHCEIRIAVSLENKKLSFDNKRT